MTMSSWSASRGARGITVGVAASALLLTACGGASEDGATGEGGVTLVVGDKPTADRAEELQVWEDRVAQFEADNPDVTVEGQETAYDPQTFQAQVAGGNLPTVLLVPFTEPQALLQREQIADITAPLESTGLLDVLNPSLLPVVQDDAGQTFGVPVGAYSVGLVYNRALFEEAGLDPDAPPRTWEEVRAAAARISEGTDAAGYAQMSTQGTGGWMFTAETYSFGGRIQSEDGEEVLFDDDPAAQLLGALSAMRWEDGSMGSNVLYDIESIAQDFAAGRIGMYVAAPDAWNNVVTRFGMAQEDYGVGPIPRGVEDDGYGTLTGGTVAVVSPSASEEEQEAAVRWIEHSYLERFVDEEAAVAEAEGLAGSDVPIGLPGLSPVSEEAYEQWQGWIADYVNVPVENFSAYLDAIPEQELVPEPVNEAQQVYASLDTVIQTVLTEEGADPEAVLSEAAEAVQTQLDRG